MTSVNLNLDQPTEAHEFYNHEDEALYRMCEYLSYISLPRRNSLLSYRLADRPELFEYAPVGLQVIGKTQEEEAVIRMTEIMDDALKRLRLDHEF